MTRMPEGLQEIFSRHAEDFSDCVSTLEEAAAATLIGNLDSSLRAAAERDAHTLAGSLGMFGLSRGSELALEIEASLAPSAVDGPRLTRRVRDLRSRLSDAAPRPSPVQDLERVRHVATRS